MSVELTPKKIRFGRFGRLRRLGVGERKNSPPNPKPQTPNPTLNPKPKPQTLTPKALKKKPSPITPKPRLCKRAEAGVLEPELRPDTADEARARFFFFLLGGGGCYRGLDFIGFFWWCRFFRGF